MKTRYVTAGVGLVLLLGGLGILSPWADAPAEPTDISGFLRQDIAAISSGVVDVKGGLSEVSANLEGIVAEVLVSEGERVEKGQVLAIQEERSERIALEEAEAERRIARARLESSRLRRAAADRDLKRLQPLYDIGAVTSQEYDTTQDRYQQAVVEEKTNELSLAKSEVAVAQTKFKLGQRSIRSPVAGRVVAVKARPGFGTSTTNISSLFTLIPDAPLIIRATVDLSALPDLKAGQAARAFVGFDRTKSYPATLTRIASYLELPKEGDAPQTAASQVIDIILELEGGDLLIGQQVNVELLRPDAAAGKAAT